MTAGTTVDRTAPAHAPSWDALVLVARFHGLAGEAGGLAHAFGNDTSDPGTLVRAGRQLGLKARSVTARWDQLADTPLPALAQDEDGQWFVLARLTDDKVLIHDPRAGRPEALVREDFEARWNGRLLLLTRRARLGEAGKAFNLSWFIPSIVKYRKLLGEVLLASFFLQLFALATPLFFQVVVDKVLVHKGLTTLDVLCIGLLVLSLFEVTLGGLRTYLFSHTTNRIDVTLGARLYRHVLALPIAYFQARRVGDTVARVRELDSIRNFITSSALTVVIDLLFTGVFLAVMWLYSPMLTFIVLGAIPAYVLLSVLVTPVLRARLNEKFARGADNQSFLVESVSNVETLKAMAVEPPSFDTLRRRCLIGLGWRSKSCTTRPQIAFAVGLSTPRCLNSSSCFAPIFVRPRSWRVPRSTRWSWIASSV